MNRITQPLYNDSLGWLTLHVLVLEILGRLCWAGLQHLTRGTGGLTLIQNGPPPTRTTLIHTDNCVQGSHAKLNVTITLCRRHCHYCQH